MSNVTPIAREEPLKLAAEGDVFVIVKKCGSEYRTITLDAKEQAIVLEALLVNSQAWTPVG